MKRPDYLKKGEPATLFPVLSVSSKEGRTTSIVLACLTAVDELGKLMLGSIGQRMGKRASLAAFTEVCFKNQKVQFEKDSRPDGLLILQVGSREWRALVETKVGINKLDATQIEKYRALAKDHGVDCVITISNQFAVNPTTHPIESVRKSKSKIPVYHWSWMNILTQANMLCNTDTIGDPTQLHLIRELRRFLNDKSAGVKGFEQMPKEWAKLIKRVSVDDVIPARSDEAEAVIDAWHQETRHLSFILSRKTEVFVTERLPRKHAFDPKERRKEAMDLLRSDQQLRSELNIPGAAAPLEIVANLGHRTIEIGMSLKAPGDRKSTKARLNWILRQIKLEEMDDLHVRVHWPGKAEANSEPVSTLKDDPDLASKGKEHLVARSFDVFSSTRLGPKFAQPVKFIAELERLVPAFYGDVGASLSAWKKPAPSLKPDPITETKGPAAGELEGDQP